MIFAMMPVRAQLGPKGRWLTGNLIEFGADPLGFLTRCAQEYGDVVRLRFFNRPVCHQFATMEATLALATIAQRFAFKPVLGRRTEPWPAITLQPQGGIWVSLAPRAAPDNSTLTQVHEQHANERA